MVFDEGFVIGGIEFLDIISLAGMLFHLDLIHEGI